jgi:glycerol kinase
VTCVVAIDAGTTGIRSRAVFTDGRPDVSAYQEFTQHFPQPGWVEHDANEIWAAVRATLGEVVGRVGRAEVAAIGITNQRETVVAWDRSTGEPYGRAIVWQDRRTAGRCAELADAGALDLVRARTGLVLDPYFSGTKFEWLLTHGGVPVTDDLALGTVDAWLIWNLTGGEVLGTDATNASRTMLFDITTRRWDEELCELLHVPIAALPEVVASSGRIGMTSGRYGVPPGIPVSGVAGDQQAALFGQACFAPGMAKNTYGTGSFVLMNIGALPPPPAEGMLTTIAWTLADGTVAYALEGAIFSTGSAIQWLRDGLGLIDAAAEVGPLAASVEDSGGVYVVPAFTGLGSPWWDPYARGTIIGLTRGTTRAHVARAVVDSMAFQTRDAVEAMVRASGHPLRELRVDGGASVMDGLLQFQADQLGATVQRPTEPETTAIGAAHLAALAEGLLPDLAAVAASWRLDASFEPGPDRTAADAAHATWLRAVERSRAWAS